MIGVIDRRLGWSVIAAAAALALRPVGLTATAIVVAAGCTGAIAPVQPAAQQRIRALAWCAVVFAGAAAFAFVRWHSPFIAPQRTTAAIALGAIAAVAEELFFRRLVYGRLIGFGPAVAIAASATLFALVHVPAYGAGALPIDLAAGLLLGWQRWASGTWTAPAATHVVANLVQLW